MAPETWLHTTLGEVAEVAIGRTPARNQNAFWDSAKTTRNRWATIADIQSKFIGETSEYISERGVQHSKARIVPAGTLLMSFKLSLGRVAITSRPIYTNEAIAAFYPNGIAKTEYLYYLLPTLALEESSDRAVKGRTLNKAKLRALRLALPPVNEQLRLPPSSPRWMMPSRRPKRLSTKCRSSSATCRTNSCRAGCPDDTDGSNRCHTGD